MLKKSESLSFCLLPLLTFLLSFLNSLSYSSVDLRNCGRNIQVKWNCTYTLHTVIIPSLVLYWILNSFRMIKTTGLIVPSRRWLLSPPPHALRSSPCPLKIVVGNWTLQCVTEGELQITNSDGQAQATILKEDLAGFTFESNKGGPSHCGAKPGRFGGKTRSFWDIQ